MDTTIISCNKGSAQNVDENGRFMCKTGDGIKVKRGDTIQIDSIGLEQTGIAGDVIEIPEDFGFDKRGERIVYSPNVCGVSFAYYIHHNYEFTCRLPFRFNQKLSTDPAFPDVVNPAIINEADANGNGGYLIDNNTINPNFPVITNDFQDHINTNVDDRTLDGMRFYLFKQNQGNYPNIAGGYYDLLEGQVPISVKTGYDSPNNIATKITTDFHRCDFTPYNVMSSANTFDDALLPQPQTIKNFVFFGENKLITNIQDSTTISAGGANNADTYKGCILNKTCNYQTSTLTDHSVLLPVGQRWYGDGFASANPYLWVYGSRLNDDDICPKDNSVFPLAPVPRKIYNLFDEQDDGGGNSDWNDGYVIATNLEWSVITLSYLAPFIHSQKKFLGQVPLKTPELDLPVNKQSYASPISFGKCRDDAGAFGTAFPNPNCATPIISAHAMIPTYYDEQKYKLAHLGAVAQAGGALINDGFAPDVEKLAKDLDINVVCVSVGAVDYIGLIYNSQAGASLPAIEQGSYHLIDLCFYNKMNPCVGLFNPRINQMEAQTPTSGADGFCNTLQVGCPNSLMVFQDNGHFGLKHLHFPIYAGNTYDATPANANPDADVECVKIAVPTKLFAPHSELPLNVQDINLIHAQSGISINGLNLYNNETNAFELIVNPKEEFKYHLFNRLGFTYQQLMNDKGRPEVDLNVRYYQRNNVATAYPALFPSPITTNAVLDSSVALGLARSVPSNLPMYDLGLTSSNNNIVINTDSAVLEAVNLATKFDFPFMLIWTDLVPQIPFHSQNSGQKDNIMGVLGRGYTSGDFVYGYTQSYSYVARKDFVLSAIKTNILKPNLQPAIVGDGTTIIYKITSPIESFENPTNHRDKN